MQANPVPHSAGAAAAQYLPMYYKVLYTTFVISYPVPYSAGAAQYLPIYYKVFMAVHPTYETDHTLNTVELLKKLWAALLLLQNV